MRKSKLVLLPLCALLLVGCGISPETSSTESKQHDSKIQEVYDAYKANGGTLDYETWLESIKGKDGVNGKDGVDGKDGVSVVSITKTSSSGNVDTYTITYSDGSISTFTVTNGKDGSQGIQGNQGEKGEDGHTPVITIGINGNWYVDGVDTGIAATGAKGDKGDKGDTGVSVVGTHIDENGDLICEMSDGTTINAGHVKDVTKHTVNFYVDDDLVYKTTVEDGMKITAPDESYTAGYTINYWNSKDDGGYRWLFSAYTVTSDMNLYADFTYNDYTISYVDEKYGTTLDSLTVTYDKEYTLATIDKDGWTLKGWKTNDGLSFDSTGTYRTASNLTLYADWVANQYKVTLDPNNGTVSQNEVTVTYDSQYELPTPTRTNYTFLGWYDSSGKKVSSKATWKGTENVTYTAKWTNVQNTYVFDAGDGTCDVDSMVIGWEDSYDLPTPTCVIDYLVYEFIGWYLNETLVSQSGTSWTYSNTGGVLVAKYKLDHIEYGIYPQTHISDENLITTLNTLTTTESNGWYLYDGDYYAKITAKPYKTSYTFDDGTTITKGTEYWFKCEPINWKILESNDGEYKLVSSVLLDAHCYYSSTSNRTIDGSTIYPNNYKYSDIRAWLNNEFYSKVFSLSLGDSFIQKTVVDNSASTTISSTNKYASDNTYDKVYLLSYQDYKNSNYFADDAARQCKTTDYARANGCYIYPDSSYKNNGYYWTRSPHNGDSYNASSVSSDGDFNYFYVYDTHDGVRPALTVKFE